MLYLCTLAGVAIMGGFIRWMSRTFDARPTLNQCMDFAAYTATSFFLAGIAGPYPNRWLAILVLAGASAYSTFLLFVGLPTFMHEHKEQGLLNATCVWGVSLLVLVTLLVDA